MSKQWLLGFLSLAALVTPEHAVAQGNSCDAVLVQQIENLDVRDKKSLAWLKMIDQESYAAAKQKASGSAYSSMFSADFATFKTKRDSFLSRESLSVATDLSVEEFKSYLTPGQIDAWARCNTGTTEIKVYYKDVDPAGASVVVRWDAPATVGPLRDVTFKLRGVTEQPIMDAATGLNGEQAFAVSRAEQGKPIRGTVNGKAGYNNQSFQATVYIPEYVAYIPPPTPPAKIVTDLAGRVQTSTAVWGSGSVSWQCLASDKDQDLIVVSATARNLGKSRGACVGQGSFCDSFHEYCVDTFITRGCYVNRAWHEWYKVQIAALSEPYRREVVCDPNQVRAAS